MKSKLFTIIIVLFLAVGEFGGITLADDFGIPADRFPMTIKMIGKVEGRSIGATYTITPFTDGGRQLLRALWKSDKEEFESVLDARTGRPVRAKAVDKGRSSTVTIEYTEGGALFHLLENGKHTEKRITKSGLYEGLSIDVALFGYPFTMPREIRFPSIDIESGDGKVYNMKVNLEGIETLNVGGRDLRCYKIKMSASGFWGAFAPDFYYWYQVDPPHEYIKFSGPDAEYVRVW